LAVAAANWSDNVSITVDKKENTFRFQSNGIPSHGFAEKYLIPNNPNEQPFSDKPASEFTVVSSAAFFKETEIDTTITTLPNYIDKVTSTSLGRIGVALSGAQIFNDYKNMDRSVVAKDDQVIHEHVSFLDECNGHTLVDGTSYHYHGVPVCITAGLDSAEPLQIKRLAESAFLSETQFKKLFKQHTGMTVMKYVTKLRMEKALALLTHTDYPLQIIGEKVGYKEPSTFSRKFSQYFGLSPTKFNK
jgi:AraC-like DNA-binding protein